MRAWIYVLASLLALLFVAGCMCRGSLNIEYSGEYHEHCESRTQGEP